MDRPTAVIVTTATIAGFTIHRWRLQTGCLLVLIFPLLLVDPLHSQCSHTEEDICILTLKVKKQNLGNLKQFTCLVLETRIQSPETSGHPSHEVAISSSLR